MSYDRPVIEMKHVWKKYSRTNVFHRSLREDLVGLFNLKTRGADVGVDEFWALKDVTFTVNSGETVGLYGPNGAGKSTIFKLISNVTCPTRGDLVVHGRLAPLIEIGAGFHPDLTGRENVFMNGTILGMRIPEVRRKIDSVVSFAEMEEFINMPVKKYSSGMYLRLAFSIAIHSEAEIFLIDEILTVGDEAFQKKCLDKIRELKERKRTLLVVSHDRNLMQRIADRIIFMERGAVVEDLRVSREMTEWKT